MNIRSQIRCAALLLSLCLACSPAPSTSSSGKNADSPPSKPTPPAATGTPPASAPQAQASDIAAASNGWDPAEACVYLEQAAGLRTSGYKQLDGDEYSCFTPYRVLGDSGPGLANNLAYYVEGTSKRAVQLKLVLNVNDRAKDKPALAELRKSAEALTEKALGAPIPAEAAQALSSGKAGAWTVPPTKLEVRRDDWPTGKGYSVHFLLRRAD